jgi:hypothetical protein
MSIGICKRCGSEVVQKSRSRLASVGVLLVGVFLVAALGLGVVWWAWLLWLPAALCALAGAYLLAWATIGRGRWCRGCKRFDGV